MHYTSLRGDRVQLELIEEESIPKVEMEAPTRLSVEEQRSPVVPRRASSFQGVGPRTEAPRRIAPLPLFREEQSGLLRTVYPSSS